MCSVLYLRVAASTSHQAFNVPRSVCQPTAPYPGADSPTKRAGGHCPFLLIGQRDMGVLKITPLPTLAMRKHIQVLKTLPAKGVSRAQQ